MDFHTTQDGTINDPQHLFNGSRFESGSGKPVINIQNTEEIEFYIEENL